MADEFDACECFWSHELAMRRLMSLLRQGQSYCNDNECTDLPSLPNVTGGANFFLIVMALIFVAVMYVLRPSSMRRSNDLNKSLPPPSNDGPNNDGGAPPSISWRSTRSAANEKHNPEPEHLLPVSTPHPKWHCAVVAGGVCTVPDECCIAFPVLRFSSRQLYNTWKNARSGARSFYRKNTNDNPCAHTPPPGSVSMPICILSSNTSLI